MFIILRLYPEIKNKKKNISNYVENVAPEDTYEQTTEQRHIHVK